MSNLKKKIPTLVGGAMLMTTPTAFAFDNVVNENDENYQVESDLNIEENIELLNEEGVNPLNEEEESLDSPVSYAVDIDDVERTTNQTVMEVIAEKVAVRESKDANSKELGTLEKGVHVDVYEINEKENWAKINYKGEMAYVNLDKIDAITCFVKLSAVKITARSGAGESYDELGVFEKGEMITIYKYLENGWAKVDFKGKIAFIELDDNLEDFLMDFIVTSDSAKVYKEASTKSEVLGEVKKEGAISVVFPGNEEDSVNYKEKNMAKIIYGEGYGYVNRDDITLDIGEGEVPTGEDKDNVDNTEGEKENTENTGDSTTEVTEKPQTGDAMVFSYVGALGISAMGMVSVNRKKTK